MPTLKCHQALTFDYFDTLCIICSNLCRVLAVDNCSVSFSSTRELERRDRIDSFAGNVKGG